MIVVDSSVLIDYLRGTSTRATELLETLERQETPYVVPVLCCQEVLQGAADDAEWRVLDEHLCSQRLLPLDGTFETHREAARIFYDCRRRGVTVRSTVDCLIAQQVLQVDGILLHTDEDYERIARVRPLRLLPR